MSRPLVIFGAGGQGRETLQIVRDINRAAVEWEVRIRSDGGNVSGQQPPAQVRLVWEQKQVLGRFLQLSRSEQVAAFAGDVPGAGELAEADWPAALARLALSIDSVAHHAFALATLQEDVGRRHGVVDPLELFRLTGSKDIYDVLGRQGLGPLTYTA